MLAKLLCTDLIMLHPLMRLYYKYKLGTQGIVYMLHRVGKREKGGVSYNENLKISPEYLEKVILSYRNQGFDFFSVDDLYEYLQKGRKQKKPFVVFTLDDGYIDNYTVAYPIFKKYNIPFCIYVATDFPDKRAFLWWYALAEFLEGIPDKDNRFVELRKKVLALPKEHFIENFEDLLPAFELNPLKYVCQETMTWQQIEEMSTNPLCTIGGHTVSHPSFVSLSEQEIRSEIEECVKIIENHIGKRVCHFAYPYGSLNEVNEREYKIAEQYGFKTIMTTISGGVNTKTNRWRIHRYMLSE